MAEISFEQEIDEYLMQQQVASDTSKNNYFLGSVESEQEAYIKPSRKTRTKNFKKHKTHYDDY